MAKPRVIWTPRPPPYFMVCNTLLDGNKLSAVERKFLADVRHAMSLSEKQQRWLQRLIDSATRDKPKHRRRHSLADDLDDSIPY